MQVNQVDAMVPQGMSQTQRTVEEAASVVPDGANPDSLLADAGCEHGWLTLLLSGAGGDHHRAYALLSERVCSCPHGRYDCQM